MINLTDTNDLISLITSSGADVDVVAAYVDRTTTTGAQTPGKQLTQPTTATTTTIVSSPASGDVRNVKLISVRNIDGATSNDVTIQFNDNATLITIFKCTLLAGEELVWTEGVYFHFDSNGAVYSTGIPYAVQADMEAGTSTVLVVTPSVQHYHQSACKCWGEFTANSTTVLASYNITSVADTATGAMTVTIATDFSSANWACQVTRSEDDLTLVYSSTYDAKTAGTVILRSAVEAGSGSDPTSASGNASWSFCGFGDL